MLIISCTVISHVSINTCGMLCKSHDGEFAVVRGGNAALRQEY